MKIRILIIDVKDADAIAISLEKEDDNLVILLDGGREKDAASVLIKLGAFMESVGKKTPDLIVGSHYDNDHIGGLLPIIEHYGRDLKKIWMFNTTNLEKLDWSIKKDLKEHEGILPLEEDDVIGNQYKDRYKEQEEMLIQSIEKEQQILQLIKKLDMVCEEPIAGKCQVPGWPEISILGPTQKYYDELFPQHLDIDTCIKDSLAEEGEIAGNIDDLCKVISKTRSPITPVNLNSCIFKITIGSHHFLFPADAGIDSFYNIPGYKDQLSNIFWLKMPHHGSANNINYDLIELMNPKKVAISGNNYLSQNLLACLRGKEIEVKTTQESGDLLYEFSFI